ncbi:hypothetical protein TWF569_001125 [Orbilia oligospora]|uniref:CipC-like antibiotic response protein n=1 Tax=Orbilia oligospora TaxID=2813651 RepID=A0A7C8N3Y6_ORBOL|nr:hypothetical protein TWF102_002036 [Orbilia oligospora]KAF3096607.1 hypothetical protein TWF706_007656 [Orbilia oligospora]KAF3103871.1 hypothetical protein TWF103_007027 [Orbilia oligospora]KAF3124981.1 hypothetical protein TWF569_001125 [Orbilia oligospora]KAF3128433.1 hypothetical protein TWF594_011624 [Orbilia oligospora]
MGHHKEDSTHRHEHKGNRSHELLAGAAAFAAFHAFEAHQKAQGKPVSHALAKELLAAFAAAEVEKLIETKGREKWDEYRSRSKTRDEVRERSKELYRQSYEGVIDGYEDEVEVGGHRHRHREIEEPRRRSHDHSTSRERRRRKEETAYYY